MIFGPGELLGPAQPLQRGLGTQCVGSACERTGTQHSDRRIRTRELCTLALGVQFESCVDVQCDTCIRAAIATLQQVEPPGLGHAPQTIESSLARRVLPSPPESRKPALNEMALSRICNLLRQPGIAQAGGPHVE